MKKISNNIRQIVWRKIKNEKNRLLKYFFPSAEELEAREDEEYNYYWLVEDVFADQDEYRGECKPTG